MLMVLITEALLVVVDRTQQSGAASLIAQSRLLCLVHVLLHVLKAWALLVHVASITSRGDILL